MTINGKRDGFTRSDILEAAASIGRFEAKANEIVDEVIAVVIRWEDFAEQAGVYETLTRKIHSNLRLSL